MFSIQAMPRERKRRTDRGVPLPVLTLAADAVNNEGRTVRSVAKDFGICHTTLYRFIVKTEKLGPGEEVKAGYWTPRRVFSDEQEKSLAEYIKTAADLFYGLSTKEVSNSKVLKQSVCSLFKLCVYQSKTVEERLVGRMTVK